MRVCILTSTFPFDKRVRPGIHVFKQAQHMVKLGLEVDVLAPHAYGTVHHEIMDGINLHRVQYMWPGQLQTLCYGAGIETNLRNSFWAKLQLPLLVLALFLNTIRIAWKSDVIHAHWPLAGLAAVLAGKLLGKPVIVMMHHAEARTPKGYQIIRFVLEHADYVLCNSNFTLSMVLGFSQPKAHKVVYIGVDTERFRPDVNLSLFYEREPDIPQNTPLIFSLGRFIEWKGFIHLIDAMALIDRKPAPYLMIGGHGPLEEQLKRRSHDKGVANRVKFLGFIPNDYTPVYHSVADILVLPSIVGERGDTEGLGVVLLEALACQTPCIASNVGGIPDIITDGVNGFLVEPGNPQALADKIVRLINDDKLRREMGRQGHLLIEEKFSWPARAHEILKVYQSLMRERAGDMGH